VRIVAHRHQPAPPVARVDQPVGTRLDHLAVAGSAVPLLDVDVGKLFAGLGATSAGRVLATPVILVLLVLLQLGDGRPLADVVPGSHVRPLLPGGLLWRWWRRWRRLAGGGLGQVVDELQRV